MNKSFIECISLSKLYKGKRETIDAVTDINLVVEQNEFFVIKGRSGAGKSTLLNLMCGLIKPTSGRVIIDKQDISTMSNNALSKLLSEQISIIFQSFNLLPTYNLYENIEVALVPRGLKDDEMSSVIMPLIKEFQLSDKLHLLPSELSVGQQQKVAVIRSLVKQPSVIFADEPTGSVDPETAGEILRYFKYLQKEKNITVIMATHGGITETYADNVLILENGRIKK